MKKKKLNILLLGSGGFIGRNLKEQLSLKYCLLTPNSRALNLTDEHAVAKYLKQHRPDVLINAAVYAGSRKFNNRDDVLKTNLLFFYNLVRQQNYFGKMIHFGSGAEYDKSRPIIKVKEAGFDQHIPRDSYGFYKYVCAKYIKYTKNIVCLRPFGVYGKHEDYTIRFISYAICCTVFNLPIRMNQNVVFDYLYVNDLITIVDWFITHQAKYKFYNLGRGKTIELLTIANKIVKLFNNKTKIIVKRPGLGKQYSCNIDRLINELPSIKFTNFDQSLLELYVWYKQNSGKIDQKSLYFDQ